MVSRHSSHGRYHLCAHTRRCHGCLHVLQRYFRERQPYSRPRYVNGGAMLDSLRAISFIKICLKVPETSTCVSPRQITPYMGQWRWEIEAFHKPRPLWAGQDWSFRNRVQCRRRLTGVSARTPYMDICGWGRAYVDEPTGVAVRALNIDISGRKLTPMWVRQDGNSSNPVNKTCMDLIP